MKNSSAPNDTPIVIDTLFEWSKLIVGGAFCLALPFIVLWMFWSLGRTLGGIGKGLAGGPSKACEQLGLTIQERGTLSGLAEGFFEGQRVKVSWVVGHGHGYDPSHHLTRAMVAIDPPLNLGLKATEGGKGPGIGWPEVEQYLGLEAADQERARAILEHVRPVLWNMLGGPGRVLIDDRCVTVELPGVDADAGQLEAALRRAVTLARALGESR